MFEKPFNHRSTWRGSELAADAGVYTLPDDCHAELDAAVAHLRANPLETQLLKPDYFNLPACRTFVTDIKRELTEGLGFVIIDRLEIDRLGREMATAAYWLLASMIGRPVAQNWPGRVIYNVTDSSGKKPGNGVRPDVTNADQNFHTDNSYNVCPPDYVCLFCLHPAKSGGISGVASLEAAHNLLRAAEPEHLPRLYQSFTFDRQREHGEGDKMTIDNPVFSERDGRLSARLSHQLIRQGYALNNSKIDDAGEAALSAFYSYLNDDELTKKFFFEPGQIQIVNNRFLAHRRTGFEDWPEAERKRNLTRLWLREDGLPFYNG